MSTRTISPLEAPNTIVLQAELEESYDEGRCGATAVTPGHLIQPDTATSDDQDNLVLKPHATAGGASPCWFATEDDGQGRTIDDAYAEDELLRFHRSEKGDRIYAWLEEGENVAVGDFGSSNGDGTFQKVSGTEVPLVMFLEALDLSIASGDARIRVEVL